MSRFGIDSACSYCHSLWYSHKKKCGTCCFHQNNRHRQAPLRIMKNKQSAHTNVCRPCSCSPLRIRLYSRDKIGGFVVQGILRFTNPVLSFSGHLSGRRFSAACTKIMFLLASQYGLPGLFHTAKVFYAPVLSKFILSQNSSNSPHGLPASGF